MTGRVVSLASALVMVVLLAACSGRTGAGPYAPHREADRNPSLAWELNRRAAELMEESPAEAERVLRDALVADLYFGPAHNNLGVLYLGQGKLYEAAGEFEWARKLIPGHPDPRMNLGLALEMAGRTEDAAEAYRAALEVYPGHLPTLQTLARLQVRSGAADEILEELLKDIALRGETEEWRVWARFELTRRGW